MLMDFISPLLKPPICYGFNFTVISLLFIGAADAPYIIFNFSLSMVEEAPVVVTGPALPPITGRWSLSIITTYFFSRIWATADSLGSLMLLATPEGYGMALTEERLLLETRILLFDDSRFLKD